MKQQTARERPLWPLQLLEPSLTGKAYYPTQLSSTTAAPICPHPHLSLALLFILVPTSFSSHLSWLLTGLLTALTETGSRSFHVFLDHFSSWPVPPLSVSVQWRSSLPGTYLRACLS